MTQKSDKTISDFRFLTPQINSSEQSRIQRAQQLLLAYVAKLTKTHTKKHTYKQAI